MKKYDVINHRYMIDNIIGQGGFGLTYLALDLSEKTYVVIKECVPCGKSYRDKETKNIMFSDDSFRKMQLELFRNEASILRELSDLSEVAIFKDFVSTNNTYYIVMEYVSGITLKEFVEKDGKRDFNECVTLFSPIIKCLKIIHQRGIIHRDICPENIMISSESKLLFIDFGSAINLNWNNSRNIWLPTYRKGFSPLEQYRAEYNFGTWSDIYSICATMYYCMTKSMPINAVDRIQYYDKWNHEVNENKLKQIVKKGMALQIKDRWKTVNDLLKVLT